MTVDEATFRGRTEVLTASSLIQHVTRFVVVASGSVVVTLPDARNLRIGHRVTIVSTPSGTGSVQSNTTTTLFSVSASKSRCLVLLDNETQAGVWGLQPEYNINRVRAVTSARTTVPSQFIDDWVDDLSCDAQYRLTACIVEDDEPDVIITDSNLCDYIGKVVSIVGYETCYKVDLYNGREPELESVTVITERADCADCIRCEACSDVRKVPGDEVCPPNADDEDPGDPCIDEDGDGNDEHPCLLPASDPGLFYLGTWYTIAAFFSHPDYVEGPCWCYTKWTWTGGCGENAACQRCYYWYVVQPPGQEPTCVLLAGLESCTSVAGCSGGNPFCGG